MTGSQFLGFGHYAPDRRVANAEIETRLALDEGWIARRTGIEARHFAGPQQSVVDLASPAAEMALSRAGIERKDIALTLFVTSTPERALPPSAPALAHRLGLNSGAVDLAGACAGFVYALALADSFVRLHQAPVLIAAANILSRRTDPSDRNSATIFADAAGAAILGPSTRDSGVLGMNLVSDGSSGDLIQIPEGAGTMQITNGKTLFARAVETMTTSARAALDDAKLDAAATDYFVPHQANLRIVEQVRAQLDIPRERTLLSLAEYGNSSAATIPFTLSYRQPERHYRPGDIFLFTAVGAGLIGGAVVFRW